MVRISGCEELSMKNFIRFHEMEKSKEIFLFLFSRFFYSGKKRKETYGQCLVVEELSLP